MKMSLFKQHWFTLFIGCYFLILTAFMINAALCPDGYYYWNWSEHLQLSYYDGSPLVAYVMALLTWSFGPHEFSIYLLGLLSAALTTLLIYRTARLFFSVETARIASCLWLLSPGNIRYFFLQTTYNSVLILFWALTLYCFCKLIQEKRLRYFYGCGISIGLMLLAKYTGVLLCGALFILCVAYARYRFILKNHHFYISLLLAALIFSPVIIWNHQHHWISFLYQLHHGYAGQSPGILHQLAIYLVGNIFDYGILILLLIYSGFKQRKKLFNHPHVIFTIPTLFVWLFFFVSACFAIPQTNWSAPAFFSGILLLAALLKEESAKKYLFPSVCIILAAASFIYLIGSRFPYFYIGAGPGWSQVYASKTMLEKLNPKFVKDKIIYADGYQLASYAHSFLKSRPPAYANSNQYYFWLQKARPHFSGEDVLYLSYAKTKKFPAHLNTCHPLFVEQTIQKRLLHKPYVWTLYGYDCTLSI